MAERMYMNPKTGSVGTYGDWYYTDGEGKTLNAVDEGEVVDVVKTEDGWE